jgi:SsrA-binding protein
LPGGSAGGYDKGFAGASLKKKEKPSERVAATNRAASYNYHLLERFEAGLVLVGTEVKSLRAGQASLRDAYAEVRGTELWLVNSHIPEYQPGGPFNHQPLRPRKLLLHRREIDKLAGKTQVKGMTLVALRIYFRNGKAKCELALARGKKQHDRRQAERDREARREAAAAMYKYRHRP